MSPAALWAKPLALSDLPSVCDFLSSVTLPAVALVAAFAFSVVPFAIHAGNSPFCLGPSRKPTPLSKSLVHGEAVKSRVCKFTHSDCSFRELV
jgi:hypothetical protein